VCSFDCVASCCECRHVYHDSYIVTNKTECIQQKPLVMYLTSKQNTCDALHHCFHLFTLFQVHFSYTDIHAGVGRIISVTKHHTMKVSDLLKVNSGHKSWLPQCNTTSNYTVHKHYFLLYRLPVLQILYCYCYI
jgi:hypothetical protein